MSYTKKAATNYRPLCASLFPYIIKDKFGDQGQTAKQINRKVDDTLADYWKFTVLQCDFLHKI